MKNESLNSDIRWQAEFDLMETRIKWGRNIESSRLRLHDLASHIKAVTKGEQFQQAQPIVRQAVVLALQTDLATITQLPLTWDAAPKENQIQSIVAIEKQASEMYRLIERDGSSDDTQTVSLLLAGIRKQAADWHSRAASSKSIQSSAHSDALAQKAERFRIAARQVIFSGMGTNVAKRAHAALALQSLGTPTELRTDPTLAMVEPFERPSSDIVRAVLEKRIRTEKK